MYLVAYLPTSKRWSSHLHSLCPLSWKRRPNQNLSSAQKIWVQRPRKPSRDCERSFVMLESGTPWCFWMRPSFSCPLKRWRPADLPAATHVLLGSGDERFPNLQSSRFVSCISRPRSNRTSRSLLERLESASKPLRSGWGFCKLVGWVYEYSMYDQPVSL